MANAYESYKAKCLEKGLPPLYENAEEFRKAMVEPPRPFSSDVFAGVVELTTVGLPARRVWEELVVGTDYGIETFEKNEKEEDMLQNEPNAAVVEISTKKGRGRPKKHRPYLQIIDDVPTLHVKEETPLLKEAKPLLTMSAEAFEAAILFAYEKGKEDAEVLDVEEISPIGAESFAMRAILRLKEGA